MAFLPLFAPGLANNLASAERCNTPLSEVVIDKLGYEQTGNHLAAFCNAVQWFCKHFESLYHTISDGDTAGSPKKQPPVATTA